MTNNHYAPRVKELRVARAWSQEQLAQVADLNVRTIQRIEGGEPASFETLKSIAAVLDLDVAELLEPKKSEPDSSAASPGSFLLRIDNGPQLFSYFGGSHAYQFQNDELESDEAIDTVASFLQELHDWGEIWDEVEPGERVRLAHEYSKRIKRLDELGLWVFAGRLRRKVLAGDKPITFNVLVVEIHRADNPEIIKIDPSKASVFAEAKK